MKSRSIAEKRCTERCARKCGRSSKKLYEYKLYKQIEIVEESVSKDHVHKCVKIPPKMSGSSFMGYLKGKSTLMILDLHPEMRQREFGWDLR
jgi:putative transposase